MSYESTWMTLAAGCVGISVALGFLSVIYHKVHNVGRDRIARCAAPRLH